MVEQAVHVAGGLGVGPEEHGPADASRTARSSRCNSRRNRHRGSSSPPALGADEPVVPVVELDHVVDVAPLGGDPEDAGGGIGVVGDPSTAAL